jgi:uncharacterized YigZ family protein
MPADVYRGLEAAGQGIFRNKGSKFIGLARTLNHESELKIILLDIKKLHPTARHFCYAYRINPLEERWRANDDGEPSSSAGRPIYNQIRSAELFNTLVVVVRYFGGTLLGIPGLIQAYGEAAKMALEDAGSTLKTITVQLRVQCPYPASGELMLRLKMLQVDFRTDTDAHYFSVLTAVPLSAAEVLTAECRSKGWIVESLHEQA